MILSHGKIRLIPFSSEDWKLIANWYYDKNYLEMFRHNARILTEDDLRNYPAITGGDIFLIQDISRSCVGGYVNICPTTKTNRAFTVGILIDKAFQFKGYAADSLYTILDYGFNRLGYRKAIIDIVSSNERLGKYLLDAGFILEGNLVGEAYIDGQFVDEQRLVMFDTYFNKRYKGDTKWHQD